MINFGCKCEGVILVSEGGFQAARVQIMCNCLVDQRSSGQLAVKNVHCFRPGMFEAALV